MKYNRNTVRQPLLDRFVIVISSPMDRRIVLGQRACEKVGQVGVQMAKVVFRVVLFAKALGRMRTPAAHRLWAPDAVW